MKLLHLNITRGIKTTFLGSSLPFDDGIAAGVREYGRRFGRLLKVAYWNVLVMVLLWALTQPAPGFVRAVGGLGALALMLVSRERVFNVALAEWRTDVLAARNWARGQLTALLNRWPELLPVTSASLVAVCLALLIFASVPAVSRLKGPMELSTALSWSALLVAVCLASLMFAVSRASSRVPAQSGQPGSASILGH
jgi:phosphoglycerol transferase MdoB-like AlkP superfamily enzyme